MTFGILIANAVRYVSNVRLYSKPEEHRLLAPEITAVIA